MTSHHTHHYMSSSPSSRPQNPAYPHSYRSPLPFSPTASSSASSRHPAATAATAVAAKPTSSSSSSTYWDTVLQPLSIRDAAAVSHHQQQLSSSHAPQFAQHHHPIHQLRAERYSPGAISKSTPRDCQACGRSFTSSRALNSHMASCPSRGSAPRPTPIAMPTPAPTSASDKPYVCPQCATAFKKNSNLVKHMKLVHLGERNFPCPEPMCGRLFGQKSNLNSHYKAVHLGEKPFMCPQADCARSFSQKSGLKAHIKTVHNGERPYVCHCGSSFGHRGDVR